MKLILSAVCALTAMSMMATSAAAQSEQFSSPDGHITVKVEATDGVPTYQVSLDDVVFVEKSPLGIETDFCDFTNGLKMEKCDVSTVTDEYSLRTIKQSHVNYKATQAIFHFTKERRAIDIIFRVSNRDVAFRYQIYDTRNTKVCVVRSENSCFVMPAGTTTFLCPQSKPMTGFARTAPSYETSYTLDDETGKNGWGEGYTFPCLFRNADKGWVLISETGTDGSYVGCRLLNKGGNAYAIGFPQEGEGNGIGSTTPGMSLPAATPWRTITIGTTLANIVETTVPWDLVEPKYAASRDYTYGKGVWSWIIGMDSSCNYDEQRRYIDFAAAMGYRTVLIDALWDVQIGYEKMADLARYAKSRGVGIFLWYNSNGSWNDAPQSPKGKMDRSSIRRKEMAWMQQTGILGIKVDFFGSDKQPMMQLYEDILTDANDFGIQVIFHGCTLPRGWERMYPNYVASEAVLASENLHFGQGACDAEARNGATHTFIRNTVGSMDFGGSTLNKRYNADNNSGTIRRTSDVYALATAVLFQSSVQHFALAPNNMTDAPEWAVQFMKDVPTTWDEVRYIDGYPGRYAIMARRCGDKWYIAGINAEEKPLNVSIPLNVFDKKAKLNVYTDDAQLNGCMKSVSMPKKQTLKATIPCNGAILIVNQ